MSEIVKKIKSLIADWQKWLGKHKDKYAVVPCTAQQQIADLLSDLYYSPELQPEFRILCRDLWAEIEPGPKRFQYIDSELPATQHIEDFIKLLSGAKPELDPDSYLPAKEIAEYYGVNTKTLRKNLERRRYKNPKSWQPVHNPKVREAQYLYRIKDALPIVETLKNKKCKSVR